MNYRIEQLRYQLREDPSSRVFLRLAGLLREEGEDAEAIDVLRQGLEHHPRSLAAWLALGRSLRDVGEGAGAQEAYGRAHALDAGNAEAAQALAEAAIGRDDWRAAADLLEPLRGLASEDGGLAAMCAEVDDWIAAEEARLAEEEARLAAEAAAEAEARRRRAERLASPPTDVVRLADGDPFANLTAVGIEVEAEVQDVFAVADEEAPEAEIIVEEAEVAVVESLEELAPEAPEPESWADLAAEVAAEPELPELTPPAPEEVIEEPVYVADAAEVEAAAAAVEAGDEAVVEPLSEVEAVEPDEVEPESWADLAAEVGAEPEPAYADELVAGDVVDAEVESEVAAVEAAAGPGDELAARDVDDELDEVEPEPWTDLAAEVGAEPEPAYADELVAADATGVEAEAEVVAAEAAAEVGSELEPDLADELAGDLAEAEVAALEELVEYEESVDVEELRDSASIEADDRPLPTLTLARLAAHQGAYDLAATTLERLLEREPGNLEAAEFLERIRAGEPTPGERRGVAAKVAALRAWLDTIRLASERHGS